MFQYVKLINFLSSFFALVELTKAQHFDQSLSSAFTKDFEKQKMASLDEIQVRFEQWKSEFNQSFNSNTEEADAFINFQKVCSLVYEHNDKYNNGELSFKLKCSSRAGLSHNIKKTYLNGFVLPSAEVEQLINIKSSLEGRAEHEEYPPAPESLDYRELGYVTEVVDQGLECSSCYAYSAQAAIEGAIFKKYGKLEKLSEQNLIDCNFNGFSGNWGCNGGWMSAAFEYIIGNNGTETAATYPSEQLQSSCKYNFSNSVAFLSSYSFIQGDEENLKRALAAIGPLSLAINTSLETFINYRDGVYDDPNCNDVINHAVTLVGYGTDDSYSPTKDYWIIKNSWGTNWGENGFVRIVRGKNMCGVIKYVVYPIL